MEFKAIKSLNGLYEISNTGVLRNARTKKVIGGYVEKNGYRRVTIENKELGKVVRTTIHRLVAEAYIPNPLNKPQVNHIDLNKLNNSVENLEWVTGSENMKHAYSNGVGVEILRNYRESQRKKVTNGEDVFVSISDAARWLYSKGRCKNVVSGIAGISAVIRKKRKTYGNYEWKELKNDGLQITKSR